MLVYNSQTWRIRSLGITDSAGRIKQVSIVKKTNVSAHHAWGTPSLMGKVSPQ